MLVVELRFIFKWVVGKFFLLYLRGSRGVLKVGFLLGIVEYWFGKIF